MFKNAKILFILGLVDMERRRFLKNIHPRLGTLMQLNHASTTAKPVNTSGGVTAPFLGFVLAVQERVPSMQKNSNT